MGIRWLNGTRIFHNTLAFYIKSPVEVQPSCLVLQDQHGCCYECFNSICVRNLMDVISIRIRTACKPFGQSTAQHDKLAQGNLIRIFIFNFVNNLYQALFNMKIASLHLIRRNILFFSK